MIPSSSRFSKPLLSTFCLFNFLSFVFSCLFNFSSLRIFVCSSIRLFVFSTFSFLVFSVKMSSLWLLHVHIIVDQQTVPWPLGLDFVHSSFNFVSFCLFNFVLFSSLHVYLIEVTRSYYQQTVSWPLALNFGQHCIWCLGQSVQSHK